MAEPTGFEPATSTVTVWRSNQTELRFLSAVYTITDGSPVFKAVGI